MGGAMCVAIGGAINAYRIMYGRGGLAPRS